MAVTKPHARDHMVATLDPVTQTRKALLDAGYCPVPLNGKRPVEPAWAANAKTTTSADVLAWAMDYPYAKNTGIAHADGVLALDIDCTDDQLAGKLLSLAKRALDGPVRVGQLPKSAVFFRGVGALEHARVSVPLRWTDASGARHQVEVRGAGGQTAVCGIHPDTGKPFTWRHGDGSQARDAVSALDTPGSLPGITAVELASLLEEMRAAIEQRGPVTWGKPRDVNTGSGSPTTSSLGVTADEDFVGALLDQLPNDDLDWESWFHDVLVPVKGALGEAGYDSFARWSAKCAKHDEHECRRWWDSIDPDGRKGVGTLVKTVKDAGGWDSRLDGLLQDALARAKPSPQDEFQPIPGAAAAALPALPSPGTLLPVLGAPGTAQAPLPPPRPRLYGNHVLRGAMTLLAGRGGVSKTNLALTEAAAMVTGQKLLWDRIWFGAANPLRVLHLNRDEDDTELRRRVLGVCMHYGLDAADLSGLHARGKDSIPGDFRLVTGAQNPGVHWDSVRWLVDLLRAWKADVLQMDPLISFVSGETNDHYACLAAALQAVMRETGVAVYVLHHRRKTGVGDSATVADDNDADNIRGGGALVDLARTARVLNRMTAGQAEALHILDSDLRRRLVSVNSAAKENYYLSAYDLTWFRLETVGLGNASAPWPEDEIGVPVSWTPAAAGVLSLAEQNDLLNGLRAGAPGTGEPWSTHSQVSSDRHVSTLAEQLGLDESLVLRQIDEWLRAGVLSQDVTGSSGSGKRARRGLRVSREPIPSEFL